MSIEQGTRREILKMIQSQTGPASPLGSKVNAVSGTYVNRLWGESIAASATIPTATTAGDTLCIWMAVMPILASGLFDLRITAAVTGITTGDSINWFVTTDFPTAGTYPALTGKVPFGGRSANYPGSAGASAHPAAMFTNNGTAAGITYTNGTTGSPGVTMYATGAQVAVTTALNQMFSFVGTVGLSITAATGVVNPFPLTDAYAILMLLTDISAGSATFQALSVDVSERPFA
jgi:hypothetical protein